MLRACKFCGRRASRKTICLDDKARICRKCCDLHREGCEYHFFCWNKLI